MSGTCATFGVMAMRAPGLLTRLLTGGRSFAQLGRWRRLSRRYEQTEASARAWLEVAAMGYLFARMRIEPA
jgi:transposase